MNLLGGAPYILESPLEQQAKNAAIGSQAAQNFLGNFWKGFAASVDQTRWKEQESLRDAQLSNAVATAEFNQTRAQMGALEATQKSKAAVAMADALALQSELADRGWETTDQVPFYNFLSKHPELAETPWAASVEQKFQASEAFRLREQELMMRYGMTRDGQLKIETDPTTGERFFFSGTTWHRIPRNADPVNLARLKAAWDAINRDPVLTAEEKIAKQNEVSAQFGAEPVDGPVTSTGTVEDWVRDPATGRLMPAQPRAQPAIEPVPDVGISPGTNFFDNLNRGIEFSR